MAQHKYTSVPRNPDDTSSASSASPVPTPPSSTSSNSSNDRNPRANNANIDIEAQTTRGARNSSNVKMTKAENDSFEAGACSGILCAVVGIPLLFLMLWAFWCILTIIFGIFGIHWPAREVVLKNGTWVSGFDEGYQKGVEKALEAVKELRAYRWNETVIA